MTSTLIKRIALPVAMLVVVAAAVVASTGAFFSDTETSTGNTFTAGAIDLQIDSVQHYNGMVCAAVDENYQWVPESAVTLDLETQQPIVGSYNPEDYTGSYPVVDSACTGTWPLTDLTENFVSVHKFFDFGDLKPGDSGENTISLHIETNDAYMCAALANVDEADNDQTEPEALDDENGNDGAELDENLSFFAWVDDGDNVFEDEQVLGSAYASQLVNQTWALAEGGDEPISAGETGYIAIAWCVGEFDGSDCDGSEVDNASQTDEWSTDIKFYVEQARNNEDFSCEGVFVQ